MSDSASGKSKKAKKQSEDGSSSEVSSTSTSSTATLGNSSSLVPPTISVSTEGGDGTTKSKRSSRNSITVTTPKSEEKSKEKSKDKDRKKLAKEASHSAQTTPVPITGESPYLHEATVSKHAGRLKGWKKRELKLKKNGDLEYYHNSRLRGCFSVLSSVIILSRHDPCRFEIDTGRGVWHLRTPTAADREVWTKKIAQIQGPSEKPAESSTSHLEARIQALNKNIAVAKSLEAVLASRMDVIKSEPKANIILDASTELTPHIVLDDSAEHHKKKKKGHSRTKSEDVHGGPTFLQQAQEIQRTISQLLASIDAISQEISETVTKLESHSKADRDGQSSPAGSNKGNSKTPSNSSSMAEDEGKESHGPVEPMIIYDHEHSGSDSEDYFDADEESDDLGDEDDSSSSSAEFFEAHTVVSAAHASSSSSSMATPKKSKNGTMMSSSSDLASSSQPSTPTTGSSQSTNNSHFTTATSSPTPAKKKAKTKSRRLSRGFSEETRQASLKIKLKPSGVSVADTLADIPDGWKPRTTLPFDKPKGGSIPLMKILKDAVGKDISRITIPVSFSEPINMLQKMVEDFEYGELLLRAAEEPDVRMRLLYITAFASSSYASIYVRRHKPFNPLLGETFEFVDEERQFRLMTEQVSHHPPIAAFTVDSPGYAMWGHAHAKTKFWGKSLEVNPIGNITLRLHKFDEVYTWNKLTTCMNNLIVGTKWIDNYGALSVYNQTTGHKCLVDFKKQGWFGAHAFEVVGSAYDPDDTVTFKIQGLWNESISATPAGGDPAAVPAEPVVIWKKTPIPEHAEKQYMFTAYTTRMNELPDWMRPYLPPTDSRLRPDQRALEDAITDLAQSEKSRLEDKQRAARKKLEEAKGTYEPTWFTRGDGDSWVYKGGYWEAREAKNWPASLPDIF